MANEYKEVNGTHFHKETDAQVCRILSNSVGENTKLRIFMGDERKTWLEEHEVIGWIGRSCGSIKVPLMLNTRRSDGGGAILDHCITRIQDAKTGIVLFEAPHFKMPVFDVKAANDELQAQGYTTSVYAEGEGNVANFKSRTEAERWVAFMSGRNMKHEWK